MAEHARGPGSPGAEEGGALDDETRSALRAEAARPFRKGDVLFREGDPATEVFVLASGRVRLLKRVRMVDRSLSVLHTGEVFGEGAVAPSAVRRSTAIGIADGAVLAFDRAALRRVFERSPRLSEHVFTRLVARLHDAEDQIEVLMIGDAQSKVVSALLKMVERQPGLTSLALSPVDLASRVGLDVDSVKRTVQRLRDQQYVRITGERVEIPDLDALHRLYALLGAKDELRGER